MVHYIRFLKPPTPVGTENRGATVIKTVVTVTTDLGDDFYCADLALKVRVMQRKGDEFGPVFAKDITWRGGARALPIEFNVSKSQSTSWFKLHVSGPFEEDERPLSVASIPEIVEAWSDRFQVTQSITPSRMVCRLLDLNPFSKLRIWEETGESIARHVWDAGLGMIALMRCRLISSAKVDPADRSLLDYASAERHGKLNVIELGSGCGLVGVALAQMRPNSSILLTDLIDAMPTLERNLREADCASDALLQKCVLDWNEALPCAAKKSFDLILISDCAYNKDSSPALVRTITSLVELSRDAVVLVSMKVRHASEAVFFDLMTDAGFVQVQHDTISLPDRSKELTGEATETVEVFTFRGEDGDAKSPLLF